MKTRFLQIVKPRFILAHLTLVVLGLLLLLLTLPGCGPHSTSSRPKANGYGEYDPTEQTGFTKDVKTSEHKTVHVPYTISGKKKIFNEMQGELNTTSDLLLAKTIKGATIKIANAKNERVELNPTHLDIQIDLSPMHAGLPDKLQFFCPLEKSANEIQISQNCSQKNPLASSFQFSVNLKCHDVNCRVTEIRLLKRNAGSEKVLGQVGILYTTTYPKIRVLKARDKENFQNSALVALDQRATQAKPVQTSVTVVNGPAYSRIQLDDVMDVQTELLETNEVSTNVNSVEIQKDQNFSGELVGNDPETGSLIIDVSDKKSDEIARIYIESTEPLEDEPETTAPTDKTSDDTASGDGADISIIPPTDAILDQAQDGTNNTGAEAEANANGESEIPTAAQTESPAAPTDPAPVAPIVPTTPSTETPKPNGGNTESSAPKPKPSVPAQTIGSPLVPPKKLNSKSLFDVHLNTRQLPRTANVTSDFVQYADNKEVQRMIRVWLGKEKNISCAPAYNKQKLVQFLTHAPQVAPYLEQVTQATDVTPEIGYTLLMESNYALTPQFDTLISNRGSTAYGPWQILDNTAEGIKKSNNVPFYIFKKAGRNRNPNDDRAYFMNSTYMASLHFQELFERFDHDAGLAIYAYHVGEGGAKESLRQAVKIGRFATTLNDILKYHVQSRKNCIRLNYAFAFLAARTIGQNLDFYGLDKLPKSQSQNYLKHLKNPRGPLPPGV